MQATSERHAEKLNPGFIFTPSLWQSTTTQPKNRCEWLHDYLKVKQ